MLIAQARQKDFDPMGIDTKIFRQGRNFR